MALMRKNDAWTIQAVANARKYRTILEMRDVLKLSWRDIAERTNYCQSYARRTYERAKMLLGSDDKIRRLQHPKKTLEQRAQIAAAAQPLIERDEMGLIRKRIREEKHRTVITLREEKRLKFAEIAERMGYSKSNVTAMYHKAVSLRKPSLELCE